MDPACLTGVDDLLTLGDFNEPAAWQVSGEAQGDTGSKRPSWNLGKWLLLRMVDFSVSFCFKLYAQSGIGIV